MDNKIQIKFPEVSLIARTPEAEKVVALAAKLCYSNTDPKKIYDSLTDEEVSKYLSHLESYGHESPVEHASYTFLITGMTRSCLAQITRHRIASFSVQSQRYINFSDFCVGTPQYIEYPVHFESHVNNDEIFSQEAMQSSIDMAFESSMNYARDNYKYIRDSILFMLISRYICQNVDQLFDFFHEFEINTPYGIFKITRDWYEDSYSKPFEQAQYPKHDPFMLLSIDKRLEVLKLAFGNKNFLKEFNKDSKIANENARCVLPNAVVCNMVVTMNCRQLRHFFNLRCCNRAQAEIRSIAWSMLRICKKETPALFTKAGPSCLYGSCNEGAMTCGNPYKPE